MDTIAEEFLPDDTLRRLAGKSELKDIRFLQMTVDTSEQTLGDLGVRLPNIEQLRLSNSNITTLRDLGTALGKLRVMWLARSGLQELEGIGAFGMLAELYVAFNGISDISPLTDMEQLQVLDLEANAIADPAQVQYLCDCTELHALTLEGNPIAEGNDYRQQVLSALPQLELLDDEPAEARGEGEEGRRSVAEQETALATDASSLSPRKLELRRELRLISDGIKYADPLRNFDVMSFEALSLADTVAAPRGESAGSSSVVPSSRGLSSRGSVGPIGNAWGEADA